MRLAARGRMFGHGRVRDDSHALLKNVQNASTHPITHLGIRPDGDGISGRADAPKGKAIATLYCRASGAAPTGAEGAVFVNIICLSSLPHSLNGQKCRALE